MLICTDQETGHDASALGWAALLCRFTSTHASEMLGKSHIQSVAERRPPSASQSGPKASVGRQLQALLKCPLNCSRTSTPYDPDHENHPCRPCCVFCAHPTALHHFLPSEPPYQSKHRSAGSLPVPLQLPRLQHARKENGQLGARGQQMRLTSLKSDAGSAATNRSGRWHD